MREKKFTPGPWEWNGAAGVTESKGEPGDRTRVCDVWNNRAGMDHPDHLVKANANLIAAAPELLEALEGLLLHYTSMVDSGDCGSWDPEEDEDVVQSRIAIAKVYGE